MFYDSDERPRRLAAYIIEQKGTVRSAAAAFGISKSTVHKDVAIRLKRIDPVLYKEVREILDNNRSERHVRGGNATKRKYEMEKWAKIDKKIV